MRSELGASPEHLEWIVSGYLLAFAVLLITGGRLGDLIGRRRAFVIGVLGFTAASALAFAAWNPDVLVAARVIQGAFAALMVPQGLSTIQALFAPRERAAVFGIAGGVAGLAAVIGPVLGGWLVTADPLGVGWRGIFLINLPIGVALVIAAILVVPETRSGHPLRLDPIGVLLATAGVLLLVYPLIEGRRLDWPWWTVAMLVGSVAVLALFVAQQRRRERTRGSALLPMRLFGDRGFSAGLVTQAAMQAGVGSIFLILAIYLQVGVRDTALHAGLVLLPYSIGAFAGSGAAVPLGQRLGKRIVVLGGLVQAVGVAWALWAIGADAGVLGDWTLVGPLALAGVGLGLEVVPLVDVALATVPVDDAGAASGAYSTFQQFGASLGIAVVGAVFFGLVGSDYTEPVLRSALIAAGLVSAAAFAISALAALLLPGMRAVRAHAEAEERALADA